MILSAFLMIAGLSCNGTASDIPTSATPVPQLTLKPDVRLLAFQKARQSQLDLLNKELADLQIQIDIQQVATDAANQRDLTDLSNSIRWTIEESKSTKLELQRLDLAAEKRHYEDNLDEVQQYKTIQDYYESKASQYEEVTGKLIPLKIDIDQGIPGSKQKYDDLLQIRKLLYQDINDIKLIIEK